MSKRRKRKTAKIISAPIALDNNTAETIWLAQDFAQLDMPENGTAPILDAEIICNNKYESVQRYFEFLTGRCDGDYDSLCLFHDQDSIYQD